MLLHTRWFGNALTVRLRGVLPVLGLLMFLHLDNCQAQDIGLQLVEAEQSALATRQVDPSSAATLPPPAELRALPNNQPAPRLVRSACDITLASAATQGELPKDLSGHLFTNLQLDSLKLREWGPSEYNWEAPKMCHNPLYFEQVAAERYGQSIAPCFQPLISVGCFYGDFVALPLQMALACPCSCEYAYGYYRPGSPAPCVSPCAQ